MPSDVRFLDDASAPITGLNFGSVDAGGSVVRKIFVSNQGTTGISSATVKLSRSGISDGVNNVSMAFDDGTSNPGTYQTADKVIGNIAASESVPIWLKVAPPAGASPAGNPRTFDVVLTYTAT